MDLLFSENVCLVEW